VGVYFDAPPFSDVIKEAVEQKTSNNTNGTIFWLFLSATFGLPCARSRRVRADINCLWKPIAKLSTTRFPSKVVMGNDRGGAGSRAIGELEFKIVTDDFKTAKQILPEYEILKLDVHGDYFILQNAPYLILSNSSFAFFPCVDESELKVLPCA